MHACIAVPPQRPNWLADLGRWWHPDGLGVPDAVRSLEAVVTKDPPSVAPVLYVAYALAETRAAMPPRPMRRNLLLQAALGALDAVQIQMIMDWAVQYKQLLVWAFAFEQHGAAARIRMAARNQGGDIPDQAGVGGGIPACPSRFRHRDAVVLAMEARLGCGWLPVEEWGWRNGGGWGGGRSQPAGRTARRSTTWIVRCSGS